MNVRRLAATAPLLFAVALGCATSSPPTASCPQGPELLSDPRAMRAHADAALARDEHDLAYRYLVLIEALHPESEESDAAYPVAAALFKRAWWKHRHTKPDAIWLGAEPAFLFHWLGTFYGDGQEFPKREADALFVGMPHGFLVDFETWAKPQPRISQWKITAEEDNGIIEAVSAEREKTAR
jgi:hypothetical protein